MRTARRGSRKLALDMLFEHDLSGAPIEQIAGRYSSNPAFEYAHQVVRGVESHREEIDAVIRRHAVDWEIERMPVVDRNVLRIALYEMMHCDDIPDGVAIDEAVALVKIYSTEESGKFVNGVLGAALREKEVPNA